MFKNRKCVCLIIVIAKLMKIRKNIYVICTENRLGSTDVEF